MIDQNQNYFSIKDELSWKEIAAQIDNENKNNFHLNKQKKSEQEQDAKWLNLIEGTDHGQLALDIYETPADLIVEAPIAGVNAEDLDISIHNDMLTIKGQRNRQCKVERQDLIYQECHWGAFSRTIILPVDVISDRIDASMKNGILTILLPKATPAGSIKVKVHD